MKPCSTCGKDHNGATKCCEKCKASAKKWRVEHKDRCREQRQEWDAANPERRREIGRGTSKRYREKHPQRNRATWLKTQYGLSIEDYDRMLDEQNGLCAICDEPPKGKRLAVDHHHASGQIRRLLCDRCNHMIGHSQESPRVLRKAADYIEHHNA